MEPSKDDLKLLNLYGEAQSQLINSKTQYLDKDVSKQSEFEKFTVHMNKGPFTATNNVKITSFYADNDANKEAGTLHQIIESAFEYDGKKHSFKQEGIVNKTKHEQTITLDGKLLKMPEHN